VPDDATTINKPDQVQDLVDLFFKKSLLNQYSPISQHSATKMNQNTVRKCSVLEEERSGAIPGITSAEVQNHSPIQQLRQLRPLPSEIIK